MQILNPRVPLCAHDNDPSSLGSEELIEGTPAIWSTTQTGNLFILDREFVVVCDFFSISDVSLGVYHNLLACLEVDDLGIAVGLHNRGRGSR